ncbi:hypothetical protein EJ08DRAFT_493202 [Tothia fuscella]|uniref:DNA2/NAM7 helicase helicase domain-containing protein n=1 Tax=Tothia fuscella TaxID=1048955 RepID=A0A9P4NHG6_9PEZI|nr:hypothetical protein EJ08DRAFT_493202 [Tothia fuscella]
MRDPKNRGAFMMSFRAGDKKESAEAATIMPVYGTRVKVEILNGKFTGQVIEDHLSLGDDFVVACRGSRTWNPDKEVLFDATIEFVNDPTSVNRRMISIKDLMRGQTRDDIGPDFPAMLLGAPEKVVNHGYLEKNLNGPKKLKVFNILRQWGLNSGQMDAVKAIFGDNDVTNVWGPAGTGKTLTTQATTDALTSVGLKCMVTGPSHQSVDQAMAKLKAKAVDLSKLKMAKRRPPMCLLLSSGTPKSSPKRLPFGDSSAIPWPNPTTCTKPITIMSLRSKTLQPGPDPSVRTSKSISLLNAISNSRIFWETLIEPKRRPRT